MKKKTLLIYVLAFILAFALMIAPRSSLADAGNFSGGSDYGGGSDSDYYGDGGGGGWIGIAFVAVLYAIFWIVGKFKKKKDANLDALKGKDPMFSEEAFKEHVANLYVKMQKHWQDKDWGEMRANMTDALFNQLSRQLQQLIDTNRTNIVKNIMVQRVDIVGYAQDEINDIITTSVATRIIDYTIDDATQKVVGGSVTAEKFMVYEWTLIRSKNAVTGENKFVDAKKCPSCGAPMDMNFSAKCNYCGSLVIASEYDWVLSAIKGISQRTG